MLGVQNLNKENSLPPTLPEEKFLDSIGDDKIIFERGEFKYFIAEIKEMMEESKIIDIGKAIHNAKYFAEIERRIADIKAGKNLVTFTEEEWEKFVNENDVP